jgi:hypothetical protein
MKKAVTSTIKKIMEDVTAELLQDINTEDNYFHDKRSKPYFQYDINCGLCEDWAMRVVKKINALNLKVSCYDVDNNQFRKYEDWANHVFVKIGNKYYDCECLNGVTSISKLPIYSRNGPLTRNQCRKFY